MNQPPKERADAFSRLGSTPIGARLMTFLANLGEGRDPTVRNAARSIVLAAFAERVPDQTLQRLAELRQAELVHALETMHARGVTADTTPMYLRFHLGPPCHADMVGEPGRASALSPKTRRRALALDQEDEAELFRHGMSGWEALGDILWTTGNTVARDALLLEFTGRLSATASRRIGALDYPRTMGMVAEFSLYGLDRAGLLAVLERGYGPGAGRVGVRLRNRPAGRPERAHAAA